MNEVAYLTGISLKENRVLIKRFEKLTKTEGGIILPDDDQKAPEGGTIVAVGPDAQDLLGQKVRFLEQGKSVMIADESYYLSRSTDIWCTID
jgi:co-chaperonin GroES (HSP10)